MQKTDQIKTEEVESPFLDKMNAISTGEWTKTRDKIILSCDVSITTFYRWLRGVEPSKLEKEKIAEILQTSVQKLWPNENN